MSIVHNFCESRINNFTPPEIFNAYSSLIISGVPFYFGFPHEQSFLYVSIMFIFTGLSSFYYHYFLTNYGKQADEIPMILSVGIGFQNIIKINLKKNERNYKYLSTLNIFSMLLFIIFNTNPENDPYFPHIFTLYLLPLVYFLQINEKKYNITYKKDLLISAIGSGAWLISENFCNKYTTYGHVIWHMLFPIGFYKIVLNYDSYISKEKLLL